MTFLKVSLCTMLAILSFGCATMPQTNLKKGERVELAYSQIPPTNVVTKTWQTVAFKVVSLAAATILKREASKYDGAYEAKTSGCDFVSLDLSRSPQRTMSGFLVMTRTVNASPICVASFIVKQETVKGSSKGYFSIVPTRITVVGTKAKLTTFWSSLLKADSEKMVIKVSVRFPDAGQKDGSVVCEHAFLVSGIKPGADIRLGDGYASDVFEIPSDGPASISVQVYEEVSMGKWLLMIVKVL